VGLSIESFFWLETFWGYGRPGLRAKLDTYILYIYTLDDTKALANASQTFSTPLFGMNSAASSRFQVMKS